MPACIFIVFALLVGLSGGQPAPKPVSGFDQLLKQAFEWHRQQQYTHSIPLLEKAHALRPADVTVNLLLGIDLLRSGKPYDAIAYLNEARKGDAADSAATGYVAEAYAALNRFDMTAELLRESAKSGNSTEGDLALIKFYIHRFGAIAEELRLTAAGLAYAYRLQAIPLHTKLDPKEIEALLAARQIAPQMPGLSSAIGLAEIAQGKFEAARTDLDLASELDPNDLDSIVGQAVLAIHNGNSDRAGQLLGLVQQRSPHRFDAAIREWPSGIPQPSQLPTVPSETSSRKTPAELFQQQRWEEIAAQLNKGSSDAQRNLWLGTALVRLDRGGDAIPPLERAAQQPSLRLLANYWLSLCYASGAEEIAKQFRANRGDVLLTHIVQAELLLRLSRHGAAAQSEFEKAAALAPNDPSVWAGLAEARIMAGDTSGARLAAKTALAIDPNRIPALRVFAEAAIQERDYSAAIPFARKLLEKKPDDPTADVLLGTAYAKSGSHQLAARYLAAALRSGYLDEKGALHYLLGTSLRRLGNTRAADEALRQAEKISEAYAQATHVAGKPPQ